MSKNPPRTPWLKWFSHIRPQSDGNIVLFSCNLRSQLKSCHSWRQNRIPCEIKGLLSNPDAQKCFASEINSRRNKQQKEGESSQPDSNKEEKQHAKSIQMKGRRLIHAVNLMLALDLYITCSSELTSPLKQKRKKQADAAVKCNFDQACQTSKWWKMSWVCSFIYCLFRREKKA